MLIPIKQKPGLHKQQGLSAILITVALVFLLGFVALAIDVNHMVLNKTKLQNAVDTAALAGATVAAKMETTSESDVLNAVEDAVEELLDEYDGAAGNHELKLSVGDSFTLDVQLGNDAKAASSFPASGSGYISSYNAEGDTYVRVQITAYSLTKYFLGLFGADKNLTISAVAGPSVGGGSCNILPIVVCDHPSGFVNKKAYALKLISWGEDMGSGNFQLRDVGSGAKSVELSLAEGYDECDLVDPSGTSSSVITIDSEPGNKVGPVAVGLNARFNDSNLATNITSDVYTGEIMDQAHLTVEFDDGLDALGVQIPYEDWITVTDSSGSASVDANGDPTWGVDEYSGLVAGCIADSDECNTSGTEGQREIVVPIIDCSGDDSGKSQYNVERYACFYLLNKAPKNSGVGQLPVFGQYMDTCLVDNARPGDESGDDNGPFEIVLYKDPVRQGS